MVNVKVTVDDCETERCEMEASFEGECERVSAVADTSLECVAEAETERDEVSADSDRSGDRDAVAD